MPIYELLFKCSSKHCYWFEAAKLIGNFGQLVSGLTASKGSEGLCSIRMFGGDYPGSRIY
jgi:hypothetical protein